LTFEDGTGYSETSLNNCQYTLCASSPKSEYLRYIAAETCHIASDCRFGLYVKNVLSATHILYNMFFKFYFKKELTNIFYLVTAFPFF
jgi:hypothetical protein